MMDNDVLVQGTSLLRKDPSAAVYVAGFFEGISYALVEPPTKYIWDAGDNRLTAFNLDVDPEETSPRIVAGGEKDQVIERLRAFLAHQEAAFSRQ
jgi:hypothetical protein